MTSSAPTSGRCTHRASSFRATLPRRPGPEHPPPGRHPDDGRLRRAMSETTAASRPDTGASTVPHTKIAETPRNLPIHLTSFVGRQAELAAVSALLVGRRLVTLTGVGGSGKTRLAARLAADVVAATVGVLVEPVQGPLRSLTAQLRNRRMLVFLDNCEQVLAGAAKVAE